ncbi:hypothetical protein DXG01_006723 [Tephrocybe rancida]|nr:hypothetical protein DXG01_006723 [Tephrocybe rancida]
MASSKSPASPRGTRRVGSALSRVERSKIRIMSKYGLTRADIARRVGRSKRCVERVLQRVVYVADDERDDWDEVDLYFLRKYPPIQSLNKRPAPPNTHRPRMARSTESSLTPEPNTMSEEEARSTVNAKNSSSQAPEPVIIKVEDDPLPLPELETFLVNLEHDLSGLLGALRANDLGTSEKLFAFASWSEQKLHRLFKEMFPQLTIPQRHMLVNGLKEYA